MSVCKSCMLTGLLSAVTAAAVTAAFLSGSNLQAKHLRHNVNRTIKQLNRAIDGMM